MHAGVTHRGNGAVAAGHTDVARVGAQVLEAGGNAIDAVVAMMTAGSVCEGTLTSLGGGGFIIAGGGALTSPILVDCFVRQPGLDAHAWHAPWEVHALELDGILLRYGTGPASIAVPGMPRGLAYASQRYGRLALTDVMLPAAEIAQLGVVLTATQAGEHVANASLLARNLDAAAVFHAEDRVLQEGELFRQPQLAAAIEELAASNCESMYTGAIAQEFVRWAQARGARVTATDLAQYRVIERRPDMLCVDDVCMYANPAPAMGGELAVRILREILDDRQALKLDGADRRVPRDLVAARALVRVLQQIDPPRTIPPQDGEAVVIDHIEAPAGSPLHDAVEQALHDRGLPLGEDEPFASSPSTTHVSAIDADGMVAGATSSVGFGSGEFIPGTGIHLNNMLAEYDHRRSRPPGETVPSMMTPAILTSPRTLVQIGSAGSDRIPHAIAQILDRMWDGMPLEDAIHAPRMTYDGDVLHAEPGFDEDALEALARNYEIVRWPHRDSFFGTTNGTAMRGNRPYAAGDPRREACGIVL